MKIIHQEATLIDVWLHSEKDMIMLSSLIPLKSLGKMAESFEYFVSSMNAPLPRDELMLSFSLSWSKMKSSLVS